MDYEKCTFGVIGGTNSHNRTNYKHASQSFLYKVILLVL